METGKAIVKIPGNIRKGETFVVKFVIIHPMETGTRKNPMNGELIAAHHLTNIEIKFGSKLVAEIETGTGVSRNPAFAVKMKTEKQGKLKIKYRDNQGNSWDTTKKIELQG